MQRMKMQSLTGWELTMSDKKQSVMLWAVLLFICCGMSVIEYVLMWAKL